MFSQTFTYGSFPVKQPTTATTCEAMLILIMTLVIALSVNGLVMEK